MTRLHSCRVGRSVQELSPLATVKRVNFPGLVHSFVKIELNCRPDTSQNVAQSGRKRHGQESQLRSKKEKKTRKILQNLGKPKPIYLMGLNKSRSSN